MDRNNNKPKAIPEFLKSMKLEPRDQLLELRDSMYWEPLQEALRLLVKEQLERLLRVNLTSLDSHELVLEKARLEGAEKLVKTLTMI